MAKRTTTPTTNNNEADQEDSAKKEPARVRGKRRRNPASVAQMPDYAALGVPEQLIPLVDEARVEYMALGRKGTDQVFNCGSVIAVVHEHAPDQATFGRWSKAIFKLNRRGAENYLNVYRHLQKHRERLVRLAVPASGLYALSSAEPERVEEVTMLLESGRELTVGEIKAIAGNGVEAAIAENGGIETGGIAGLKALIAEKVSTGVPAFMDCLFEMQREIHIALEPHRNGKKVEKGLAQAKLVHAARLAKGQLESLTWMARVPGAPVPAGIIHVLPLSREGRWYELRQLLDRMGGAEEWPDAPDVGTWFEETVVPLFAWALGSRAEKAAAVVDDMAKAAEAEQAKAEKQKAKAKAAAQKERAKARAASKKNRKKTRKTGPAAKPAEPIVVEPAATDADTSPAERPAKELAATIISGVNEAEKRRKQRTATASELGIRLPSERRSATGGGEEAQPSGSDSPSSDQLTTVSEPKPVGLEPSRREMKTSLLDEPVSEFGGKPAKKPFGPPAFLKVPAPNEEGSPKLG